MNSQEWLVGYVKSIVTTSDDLIKVNEKVGLILTSVETYRTMEELDNE